MDKFEEFARSQGFQGEFQRGCNGQFKSDLLHFMEKVWQSRQAELDQLNKVLDERTKEWLQAIKCGTYFENVAKPLKQENDNLKNQLSLQRDRSKALETELTNSRNYGDSIHSQLNNMEQCYIDMKKERDGLLDANTAMDRERNQYREQAKVYQSRTNQAKSLIIQFSKLKQDKPEMTLMAVQNSLVGYGEP